MLFIIIMTILLICGGLYLILGRHRIVKFHKRLENNQESEWENTIGHVVDTAYTYTVPDSSTDISLPFKVITPIVEYEVNGKKYEGQNDRLATSNVKGASLPIGTEVKVYYSKNEPQKCVLKTYIDIEKKSYRTSVLLGTIAIIVGILVLFILIIK